MTKKMLFGFSTLAVATALAASSHRVTLYSDSSLAGKELKAGDYKLEINDTSVVLKHGKEIAEAAAKVEEADQKFSTTKIRYNDRHEIQEIYVGGTNKKVVLTDANSAGSAPKQTLR
jgi:hypothetical protein